MPCATVTTPIRSIRHVIRPGLAFGVSMGLFIGWMTQSPYRGFGGGIFCGVAFGWAVKRFLKESMTTTRLEFDGARADFDPDEIVIHVGPANHFKGIESVGGKLFLTNKRLRFRSHKVNVQVHDESYQVDTITSVEPSRTLGMIPNGLVVHLRDGRRERFVVMGRSEWVMRLQATAEKASCRPG